MIFKRRTTFFLRKNPTCVEYTGVKWARYVERAKSECQGFLAATVVILRTIWNRTGSRSALQRL